MPQPARKAFVYAHIYSCVNYILPFCVGHTNKNKDKYVKIVVNSAKLIYATYTRRLPHDKLSEKFGFLRKDDYFEVSVATSMHKIIYDNEPNMITDYIRHPTYRAAC